MSGHPGLKRSMDWTPVDLSSKKSLRTRQYLESHKVIEKRRRDRINNYLQAIKSLLPIYMYNIPNDKRLDKADILYMTLLYLRMINSFLDNLGVKDLLSATQQQLSLLTALETWIKANSENYSSVPEFVQDLLKFMQSEQNKAFKLATETILELGETPLKGPSGRQGGRKSSPPSELLKSNSFEYTSASGCCSTVTKDDPQLDERSTSDSRPSYEFLSGEPNEELYSPEDKVNGLCSPPGCSTSGGCPTPQQISIRGCCDERVAHTIQLTRTCKEEVVNEYQTTTTKQEMGVTSGMNLQNMASNSKTVEGESRNGWVDLTRSRAASADLALSVKMPLSNLRHLGGPGNFTCSDSPDVTFDETEAVIAPRVLYCVPNPDNSGDLMNVDSDSESEQTGPKQGSNSRRNKCHCDFKVLVRDQGVNTDKSKDRSLVDKELKLKVDTGQVELDVSSLIHQAQSQNGSFSLPVTFKGQVCLDIGEKEPADPYSQSTS